MSEIFVCEFRASRDSGAPAVGYCLVFFTVNFRPLDSGGSSSQVLSSLFVCLFRASRESGAPAVRYCLSFLSTLFVGLLLEIIDMGGGSVNREIFFITYADLL